jgi:hypothetical protein
MQLKIHIQYFMKIHIQYFMKIHIQYFMQIHIQYFMPERQLMKVCQVKDRSFSVIHLTIFCCGKSNHRQDLWHVHHVTTYVNEQSWVAQVFRWAVHSAHTVQRQNQAMEETSAGRAARGWQRVMNAIGLMLEANRLNFVVLARAELRTKFAPGMKQLMHEGHAVGKCLHSTESVIHRANQHARWAVCQKCNARIKYQSLRHAHTKSQTRRATSMPPEPAYHTPLETPPRPTARSSAASMAEMNPSGETQQIIETAMQSFQAQGAQIGYVMQQVSQSLGELARGQSQMLNMMQGTPQGLPTPATAGQTPTLPENFHLDGPESMGWSDVEVEGSSPGSMFNPNEMHPDFNDQHGHRGC